MEKLTAIYIGSTYQLRNRTTDGFLHDLGEDFGIMKIRLDQASDFGLRPSISWTDSDNGQR